jgi:hypothetical protein
LSIDFGSALRRLKPDKQRRQIAPRPLSTLVAAADLTGLGRPALVLDTNIYILDAAGLLPATVAQLLDRALLFHCAVCLAELAVGVANADPALPGWATLRDHYARLFEGLPANRVLVPKPPRRECRTSTRARNCGISVWWIPTIAGRSITIAARH